MDAVVDAARVGLCPPTCFEVRPPALPFFASEREPAALPPVPVLALAESMRSLQKYKVQISTVN